jgi:outer membrane protein assembly factor BamE (lipoprotein component of BamABCDE complex)
MRYDWNLQQCWGFALVVACTLGVAACGRNNPPGAKAPAPAEAPNFPAIANVAASKGHTISRETVDRIQPGMSESDVKQLLGTPFSESSAGDGRVLMQWFDSNQQYIHIIFDKGRVTTKTYAGQNQKASNFNQANLDQVKTGMTEAKVLELLGPSQADVNTGDTRTLSWENSTHQVMVIFRNGKVATKFVNPK